MNMGAWDYLLWLTGFTLNLGLLCVLLHKRRFQKFPWFTLLIAQDAVQTIVLDAETVRIALTRVN